MGKNHRSRAKAQPPAPPGRRGLTNGNGDALAGARPVSVKSIAAGRINGLTNGRKEGMTNGARPARPSSW